MSTLSERFERVQGETLEHEGQTVRQLYRRTVSDGDRFTVELREVLVTADGSGELTAYNAWIGSHDSLHSWVGNSGLLVDDDGEAVTLRCSDGDGDPSFDDLVVVLTFEQE